MRGFGAYLGMRALRAVLCTKLAFAYLGALAFVRSATGAKPGCIS